MWVIALEALVALSLLLLIVWLTMGSSRGKDHEDKPKEIEQRRDDDRPG
jgi:hypothetical protein